MKIEFVYDGEGNLMVITPDGKAKYFYCEYGFPEAVLRILEDIPKYKG